MTSSTDSREGSPFCVDSPFDEDYTSEDISMNEFIQTHRDNILKLINTNYKHEEQEYNCEQYHENPHELSLLVPDEHTGPSYYTRGLGVDYGPYDETPTSYDNDNYQDLAASLAGMSKTSKPSPLDTSHETLDDNSPTKTPFAPVTKERRSIEDDDDFMPTSPLPLVRQLAEELGSDEPSNPSLYDIKRYMKEFNVTAEEADVLLRESNKEYPLDLPPNLEEIGNLCPDDDINMTLKEAEEDYVQDYDEDYDEDYNEDEDEDRDGEFYEELNLDERKNYLDNLELKMKKFSEELFEKQLLIEQKNIELEEKLQTFQKQEKDNTPFTRLFDVSVVIVIGWGVMKIINLISTH